MRRFRLLRWEKAYGPLEQNGVYDSELIPEGWSETIEETAKRFPNEWQEVFDIEPVKGKPFTDIPKVEPKTIHKDTDLGYFSGLAMQSLLSNQAMIDNVEKPSIDWLKKTSIIIAQELIKQLDEQTK